VIEIDRKKCTDCGYCTSICQAYALYMEGDGLMFAEDKCVSCLDCVEVCPPRAIRGEK